MIPGGGVACGVGGELWLPRGKLCWLGGGVIRGEGGGGGDGEGWGGMSLHDHRRVVGVVVVTLLPGVQRHLGDGDGVAGHQRVAANTNAIKR